MSKAIIEQKAKATEEFVSELKNAKSFLVFEYSGLTVKEMTEMRAKLHKDGASISIVKNNILNRALKANKIEVEECKGPNAVIICTDDEVCSFKAVADIAKKRNFVKFKFGLLENNIIKPDQFAKIAAIPGRKGLYSMFLSCLTGSLRNFLYGLNAVGKTKQA
ncbi:MAG: 50S ribosomal protein L10 [Mycoplasmoidaceae bacterium]|nr:50S ribosomal protein L10 [Mycoplasmoidaceae bacterium]